MALPSSIPLIGEAPKYNWKKWHGGIQSRVFIDVLCLTGIAATWYMIQQSSFTLPKTFSAEWKAAEQEKALAKPRQHSPHPVMMRPISRIRTDPNLDFVWKAAAQMDRMEKK